MEGELGTWIVTRLAFIPVYCHASKFTGGQKPWNEGSLDLLSMVGLMPVVCQTGFMDSVDKGSGNYSR